MMKDLFDKYRMQLEPKVILLIGFLLAYPLTLVAANSVPILPEGRLLLYMGIGVWVVLYLIKPVKHFLMSLIITINSLWLFSVVSTLQPNYQEGVHRMMPGSVKWATFIHDYLFGKYFIEFYEYMKALISRDIVEIDKYYYVFLAVVFIGIMSIIMSMLERRVNWKFFLFGAAYFVVAWFLYVSELKSYFSIFFVGITVYRQYSIYEMLVNDAQGLGERTRYYNYTSSIWIGTFVMIAIVFISNIVLYFVPVDNMNDTIYAYMPSISRIRTDFRKISSSRIFSFNSTIYSPNDNMLGGPITERDYSVIMSMKADEGNLYLRGRAKNVYDGHQWLSDFDLYRNNILKNVKVPDEHLSEITIFPESIATRTLFSPYKYYNSSFARDKIYGNEDSIVYRKTKRRVNFERYSLSYIKPEFVHLYETLDDDIREEYLKLPERGLVKTIELTEELVGDIEDPYEVMKTLERYLRDTYRYTLFTNEVDENQDFVEYFLFDEKQGYCTYFATSLAVMGRIADIPTRYVEGFITNDLPNIDGYYEVQANRAHAWTEAYIEGQGWVRFEATPAYTNGDEVEEEEIIRSSQSEPSTDQDTFFDEEEFANIEDESSGTIDDQEDSNIGEILVIAFYISIAAGIVWVAIAKVKRLRNDIHAGDFDEKINNRVRYLLSMCRIIDDDIDQTSLPKHVILKQVERMELTVDGDVIRMIDQSLYGNKSFTEDQFTRFDDFFKLFEGQVKKRVTLVGHFIHKVLFNTLYHKDYYS